jgi:hypothetical protein
MSALPPLGDEAQEVVVSQRSLASMTGRVNCGLTREEGLSISGRRPGRARRDSGQRQAVVSGLDKLSHDLFGRGAFEAIPR